MATYVPPQKNIEYIFYVGLVSQADTKLLQNNPTLAAGDVLVSTDGGGTSNLDTLPAVTPASSDMVKVTVSIPEMNGDNIIIVFSDAAGSEWCDLLINIQTAAQSLDAMDTNIDDIETDTATTIPGTITTLQTGVTAIIADTEDLQTQIGTDGAGLTDLGGMSAGMKAEIEAECTDAIEADGLDHLVAASVTGTDIVDNSIIAKMVSKDATADWDDFVNTTDALQAIRDKETDIETDTAVIGALGAGLTDLGGMSTTMKGQIQTECDDALVANNLDHLCKTVTAAADMTTEVADNTILSRVLASGDTSAFDPTTDSLQDNRDRRTGPTKNTALSNFTFVMRLSLDHVSVATGKTVTSQISKDGAAFANSTNSTTELSNGVYHIDLTATEMNADVVTLKFTETDCDATLITILTST